MNERKRQRIPAMGLCVFGLVSGVWAVSVEDFEGPLDDWTGPISTATMLSRSGNGLEKTWSAPQGSAFGLIEAQGGAGVVSAAKPIEAQAGDRLSFDWFWTTGYTGGSDTIRAYLVQDTNEIPTGLSLVSRDLDPDPIGSIATEWDSHSYTFSSGGDFTLFFEVSAWSETVAAPSALGIDDLRIDPAGEIPEPLSLVCLSASVLAAGGYLRRRRRGVA